VKRFFWGGKFWIAGNYINSVTKYANEEVIKKHIQEKERKDEYKKIYTPQLKLF
jgi:REP element-mobilizing transposase RayT